MKQPIRKTFRTLVLAAGGILGLLASQSLAAAPRQVVTVGTEGVYAPFTFLDEKGVITGYDVEVVQEIARRVNVEVKFVPTPWDSMFLALDARKFDLVANEIAKNPQRAQKYNFSESYMVSGAQIIVRGDRPGTFSNGYADLKGLKVGTGVGSNYSKRLEDFNQKNGNQISLKYYDGNLTTVLQDIVAGRLDATVNDRLTVGYNAKKLGTNVKVVGKPLDYEPAYFVFRKDAQGQALTTLFDQGLAQIRKDGTLAKLSHKWFGADYTR
ncbi:MAG: transporter substrate-binding domain-containing protein [Holophaga sp.]|nr:transporter substrate-binding domain-containing protein [Holophaga sp.]